MKVSQVSAAMVQQGQDNNPDFLNDENNHQEIVNLFHEITCVLSDKELREVSKHKYLRPR